jgi:hypothetical protein
MAVEPGKELLESVGADDLDLIVMDFRRCLHRRDVAHHEAVFHRFRQCLFQQRVSVSYGPGADTAIAALAAADQQAGVPPLDIERRKLLKSDLAETRTDLIFEQLSVPLLAPASNSP